MSHFKWKKDLWSMASECICELMKLHDADQISVFLKTTICGGLAQHADPVTLIFGLSGSTVAVGTWLTVERCGWGHVGIPIVLVHWDTKTVGSDDSGCVGRHVHLFLVNEQFNAKVVGIY